MDLTIPKQLEELGLSKNEALVYIAVLELGEPGIGQVEAQTGLHKQLIYNAAAKLQDQGLMSVHYIRQRRHFSITDPSAIESQMRERMAKATAMVATLHGLANEKRVSDQIRIYKGAKGIQQYYIESVRHQPDTVPYLVIGISSQRYFEIFPKDGFGFQTYERTRVEKKVPMHLILFGDKEEEVRMNSNREYMVIRHLAKANTAPFDIGIWHDRVALLFFTAEPYLLDIVGKDTVKGFEQYFQVFWDLAQPTA